MSAVRDDAHRRPRLDALTGLRFVAALHVVLYHFVGLLEWHFAPVRAFVKAGIGEVGFFFVLSGFVLTYNVSAADLVRPREFWRRRLARIYPTFLFASLLAGLIVAEHWLRSVGALGAVLRAGVSAPIVLLLLQSWLPQTGALWNGPAWSLSAEAFFYASFPVLLARLTNLRRSALQALAVALVATALVAPAVLTFVVSPPAWLRGLVLWNPIVRWPDFILGCCLGLLFVSGERRPSVDRFRGGIVIVLLFVALTGAGYLPEGFTSNGLLLPIFGLTVWVFATSHGLTARALGSRVAVFLGQISYGVYILQYPLRRMWEAFVTRWTPLLFTAYLASLLLFAAGAYVFIERPGRRLMLRGRLRQNRDAP